MLKVTEPIENVKWRLTVYLVFSYACVLEYNKGAGMFSRRKLKVFDYFLMNWITHLVAFTALSLRINKQKITLRFPTCFFTLPVYALAPSVYFCCCRINIYFWLIHTGVQGLLLFVIYSMEPLDKTDISHLLGWMGHINHRLCGKYDWVHIKNHILMRYKKL